ncbi:MAG: ATP-dependent helicase [Proteobacteria bacterium]|nr:ATP-dependent helicase [Pseudomonadota bacterium]
MVNRRIGLDDALRQEAPQFYELTDAIAPLLLRYATRKQALGLVDYDDLLQLWWRLLVECPGPRAELIERFHHVLVDEYQDTNRLQGEIVDICASAHGNLTVVGDDAQSIYAFRGAQLENMLDFPKRHPAAQIFKLEANYRSVPEILQLANKSIRNNTRQYPKQLHAVRASGALPILLRLHDVYQQAAFVAQRVLELHHEHDLALREMVVLYRAHAHSLELQLELTRRQIPFVVRSGLRLFEQAHIKDVIAFLRVVHNPRDPLAWQRVLRTWPGVGRRSAERILAELLRRSTAQPLAPKEGVLPAAEALASPAALLRLPELQSSPARAIDRATARLATLFDRMPVEAGVAALIQTVLETHYRDHLESTYPNAATRLEDLQQLAEYGQRYATLEQFLSELSLVAGFAAEATGLGSAPDDALTLSTVHQAKGLEWPVVLLIGLAEGRFPAPLAVRTPSELEEERRLFYVAATRARDQLYLCQPRFEESDQGPRRLLRLSRFVAELTDDGTCPYEPWEVETCPA